jgi:uncharacterized protein YukE
MSSFSVQPDELRRLAASLASLQGRWNGIGARLRSLGQTQTGHAGLTSALGEFLDHWRYAMGKIDEHAQGVGKKLDQAAEMYTATDTGIARAAGG